jgi:DNA-binding response OmpR family regulator
MLTNKKQESDKFWGMKQGADAYFPKPFDEQELLDTASRLLGHEDGRQTADDMRPKG